MKKVWFKRKLYGWGWYPATWQGWLITLLYCAIVILLGIAVENGTRREVILGFVLPAILATAAFIRIAYKTGDRPKLQWGKDHSDHDDKQNITR